MHSIKTKDYSVRCWNCLSTKPMLCDIILLSEKNCHDYDLIKISE